MLNRHVSETPIKVLGPINRHLNTNSIDNSKPINPWTITGLTDGDSSFGVSISLVNGRWVIQIFYVLTAKINPANYIMLQQVLDYFNYLGAHGFIKTDLPSNCYRLIFTGFDNAAILRSHFISYPLLTYKAVHFEVWCQILAIVLAKEHLTESGMNTIIGLKDHFKEGLSDQLKSAFPNYIVCECPIYNAPLHLINIFWIIGFIVADGCYFLGHQLSGSVLGQVRYSISISQHIRSVVVLQAIQSFFGFGKIYPRKGVKREWTVESIKNINKFITIIDEGVHYGAKALDYADFKKGISICNSKSHLTKRGMNQYKKLVSNMNSKRKFKKITH